MYCFNIRKIFPYPICLLESKISVFYCCSKATSKILSGGIAGVPFDANEANTAAFCLIDRRFIF